MRIRSRRKRSCRRRTPRYVGQGLVRHPRCRGSAELNALARGCRVQKELSKLEEEADLPIEEVMRRMKEEAEARGEDDDDDDEEEEFEDDEDDDDDEDDEDEDGEEEDEDEDEDDEDDEDEFLACDLYQAF